MQLKEFIMGNFDKKVEIFWRIFWERGGVNQVVLGLQNTLLIAVSGLLIGIVIGTLIATARTMPKYKLVPRILNGICGFYVSVFRGTPMVVQLLLGYYVLLPLLEIRTTPLVACVVIFGLNSGAYVSEIMRSGLLSVDYGQTEAGRALGLSYPLTLMRIVVPQAIKNILPTLGNEFITLVKETSIVSFVGAVDLCTAFKNIGNSNYEYMVPYTVMALVYIVLVLIITVAIRLMEKKLRASDKR